MIETAREERGKSYKKLKSQYKGQFLKHLFVLRELSLFILIWMIASESRSFLGNVLRRKIICGTIYQ